MTFLLRAALVIGALSYLALMRGGADPAAEAAGETSNGAARLAGVLPGAPAAAPAALTTAIEAVPSEARERAKAALARGLMAELSRRAGIAEPEAGDAPSRDTLEEADRRPAWRGVPAR